MNTKKSLSVAIVATLLWLIASGGVRAATTNVAFGGVSLTFRPAVVTINVGDTVVWSGPVGHTVTGTGADPLCGSTSVTTCTRTFNTAGNFPYQCNPHAGFGMTGLVVVVTANVAPTVSITNPAANSVFPSGQDVLIQASASDSDGSVTNVAFFRGAILIANDPTAPFSASTGSLTPGNYTLSAVASDNQGAKKTNSISVTINAPPTIALSPTGPYTVAENSSQTIGVTVTDSDNSSVTLSASPLPFSGTPYAATFTTNASGKSGTFSWTPVFGSSDSSPYTVTFQTSDGINPVVSSVATISVTMMPTSVQISNPVLTNGELSFIVSGLRVGRTNFVEVSTNLPAWLAVQTNVSTNLSFNFRDTNAAENRFYRVLEKR